MVFLLCPCQTALSAIITQLYYYNWQLLWLAYLFAILIILQTFDYVLVDGHDDDYLFIIILILITVVFMYIICIYYLLFRINSNHTIT